MSGDLVAGLWDEEEWSGSAFSNLTEEDNLTCAARNIQGPINSSYSSALTTTVRVIQSVFYLFIILAGLFLNTLVIVLVAKYKKLQTLSFFVSLQIVVLDLLLTVILVTNLITSIANEWLLGEYMCAIAGLVISVTTVARTLLMGVFVIDRYLAVAWTYFYPKHKKKITVTLSVASWVFAILVSIAMLPGLLDCYSFSVTAKVCLTSSLCSGSCSVYVRAYSGIIAPATILPVFLYALLYYKARKIQKEMALMASNVAAASENHRREWKATITFSLLFISLFVLVLPTTAVAIIVIAVSPGGDFSPASYVILALNSCVVSFLIVTDPIVIMRDGDMKEVLRNIKNDILCRRPENPEVSRRMADTTQTTEF